MADTDENYILDAWEKRICPTCGAIIADERAYGSGRIKDGRFCSLAVTGSIMRLQSLSGLTRR
jgi:hypothetical protein